MENEVDDMLFIRISKVFEKIDKDLTVGSDIDWSKEHGMLDEGRQYMLHTIKNDSEIFEGEIIVDILMGNSNLVSYSHQGEVFALIYEGDNTSTFMSNLGLSRLCSAENINHDSTEAKNNKDYDNNSVRESDGDAEASNDDAEWEEFKQETKDYYVETEYKGKHCAVQVLRKKNKRIVLKKYFENYENLVTADIIGIESRVIINNGQLYITQKYYDIEPLEDCIKRGADFIDDAFIRKLIKKILDDNEYYRYSPHNICIDKTTHKVVVVDTICLETCFSQFEDEYVFPNYLELAEKGLNVEELTNNYSAGWTAYALLGQKPELDQVTGQFKPPVFNDDFPKFWKDFISLATRTSVYDCIDTYRLKESLSGKETFKEYDFALVSPMILNHDDYLFESPIGAGGEAVIYLTTHKLTLEKHACKKIKYGIYSIEVKNMVSMIGKLDSSIYGIQYIGISHCDNENVFLHMEYVPNGSLSELIMLDKKMKAPSWFNEQAKIRISREIGEGMLSLHEQGVIHKDLKPDNILLDENNNVKICDFSLIPEESAKTPLFMSPELFNGDKATTKSDVYSYAVTLSCLFGGGEMIGSVKTAAFGGFRPSIAVSTPHSIQRIIRKCWQQNPGDRPTFREIVDDLCHCDLDEDDLRIKSMDEFPGFDIEIPKGNLSGEYDYEVCDIVKDSDTVEHLVRLHMTIQPDNMLHIHKYCRIESKIILIIEKSDFMTLDSYMKEKKKVKASHSVKYVSDFISIFELYHKNGFSFGPFSLKRLFFRGKHRSSLCFDLFAIPGLSRPQIDIEVMISPPEKAHSREEDVFSFACFVLKIFDCLTINEDGKVSAQPFKGSGFKSKSPIPPKYRSAIMVRCLGENPNTRPTFELLFQKLFPVQYRIISNFLSVSVSRFSTFSMNNDFKKEDIQFLDVLGKGTFGKVIHAFNKASCQDFAVKEFNDSDGMKPNDDFMLEFVALKAIDHPNIVKIVGASQRKESEHGSRLFMEFAGGGDLRKNINEPFEWFVIHLLQISSAMKYLHQRGIIHFDLKPENILIREDGSAVVADFNTAMHVGIDTHLRNQRGSTSYMSPEILSGEKYSFSTDVFSFGLMACEHFSSEAISKIREANERHEHPSLDFIADKNLRSLLEYCVDDDPMSRPSFDFICNFIFKKLIKDTPRAEELEGLTKIPRIDDDKLNQLRVLATRGSNEAIAEYGKYLLCENSFSDAMHVFLKGANEGDATCQNTLGVLSYTDISETIVDDPIDLIRKASEQGDMLAMINYAITEMESIEAISERAISNGYSYAGYLLGVAYENGMIEGPFEARMEKAIEAYRAAAQDGDPYAQYKYGVFLEDGLTTDESGLDCVYYFRQSAYNRCKKGCERYSKYLRGERKDFYSHLAEVLPFSSLRYVWAYEQMFFDEMMSCYIGSLLLDVESKERFKFLSNKIFKELEISE